MSKLEQINVNYSPAEDRLLLLLKTSELAEFRFWMTRRFVKSLWPVLVNCLAGNETVRGQAAREAKQAVLSFQHENAVQQSDFETSWRPEVSSTPLGSDPILLTRASLKRNERTQPVLGLYPAQGKGIDLVLDEPMLHSFCRLLARTVHNSDWGMRLSVGERGQNISMDQRKVN